MKLTEDEKFMKQALTQARKAMGLGEVPIGCVIVCEGKVIARGYNRRNTDHSTLSHAEITAIRKASKKLGDWRLEGCTLYCTLEPCPMCAGAIEQARIDRLVIGAPSDKSGCAGTILNIVANEKLMHQSEITRDVLTDECRALLQQFFKDLRIRRILEKEAAKPAARTSPEIPSQQTKASGYGTQPDHPSDMFPAKVCPVSSQGTDPADPAASSKTS